MNMPKELNRYSVIKNKFPRELLLLQGKGCVWKKCRFCDYYRDISDNTYEINQVVIKQITGKYGVVDVINSGSVFEIDEKSLNLLSDRVRELNIHTIWFESHWLYYKRLDEIRGLFPTAKVKFRIGAETFDTLIRNSWRKGIPNDISARDMAEYFDGCCLLVCINGQTKQSILKDIQLAEKHFEYVSINVFIENTTDLKRDLELVVWFENEIYPKIANNLKFEILLNNTDLGVG